MAILTISVFPGLSLNTLLKKGVEGFPVGCPGWEEWVWHPLAHGNACTCRASECTRSKALGTNQQSKRSSLISFCGGRRPPVASRSKQMVKNGKLKQVQERKKPRKLAHQKAYNIILALLIVYRWVSARR